MKHLQDILVTTTSPIRRRNESMNKRKLPDSITIFTPEGYGMCISKTEKVKFIKYIISCLPKIYKPS